jgi:hydrogenase nickel incorporation protein HypA/HybF
MPARHSSIALSPVKWNKLGMHELAICESLIEQVSALAAEHQASRVARIALQVGPLSGVEAPQLVQAFTIARSGTVAEAAELEIEVPPIVVWCDACKLASEASASQLLCAHCGSWQVSLRSGHEMVLKSLQLLKD